MIDLNNFKAVNFVQPKKQGSEYHMGLNRMGIRFNKAIAKYFNVSNSKPANLQFLIDQENKQLVITNCKRAQALPVTLSLQKALIQCLLVGVKGTFR